LSKARGEVGGLEHTKHNQIISCLRPISQPPKPQDLYRRINARIGALKETAYHVGAGWLFEAFRAFDGSLSLSACHRLVFLLLWRSDLATETEERTTIIHVCDDDDIVFVELSGLCQYFFEFYGIFRRVLQFVLRLAIIRPNLKIIVNR
jgi:hypothetical protein